jgi:hypothetical protein
MPVYTYVYDDICVVHEQSTTDVRSALRFEFNCKHRWAGRLGRSGRRARKRVLKHVLFFPQNKYGKSTPQKNAKKNGKNGKIRKKTAEKTAKVAKNGKKTRVFPR